ncbi:hypothetical protein ACS0TY_029600 [Phlomoides rotata]
MASRCLVRSLPTTKQSLTSIFRHSYTTSSTAAIPNSSSLLFRVRALVTAASTSYFRRLVPAISTRAFSTRQTTSSLSDPNPNWSNRPPKETILLDGCDFEHWLVVMDPPEGQDITRDDIIDSYIKTLATVVGSEEEARMKIYSVSTRHYFAFGALVSEELSYKIKELPRVRWVLPDSYLDVKNKDYGGEPFINGQAVPYDPKYHEEWVRNNSRAQERNKRNDRPRNFDRSRNFERRNSGPNTGGPGGNYGGQPNMAPPQANAPNAGPGQPNMGRQPNYGGGVPPTNPGNYPANNMRGPPQTAPTHQYGPGPNIGGAPYQPGPGPNQGGYPAGPQNAYGNMGGGNPYQNQNSPVRDSPSPPNQGFGPGQNSGYFDPTAAYAPNVGPDQGQFQNAPNVGPGQGQFQNALNVGPGQGQFQNAYAPQQNQNVQGRDFPPPSNY